MRWSTWNGAHAVHMTNCVFPAPFARGSRRIELLNQTLTTSSDIGSFSPPSLYRPHLVTWVVVKLPFQLYGFSFSRQDTVQANRQNPEVLVKLCRHLQGSWNLHMLKHSRILPHGTMFILLIQLNYISSQRHGAWQEEHDADKSLSLTLWLF